MHPALLSTSRRPWGRLLSSMEDWTGGELDTTHYREGHGSLRLTGSTQQNATLTGPFDLSDCDVIRFSVRINGDYNAFNTLRLQLFTDGSNYYNLALGGSSGRPLYHGLDVPSTDYWCAVNVPQSAFPITNAPSWSNIAYIRWQLNPASEQTPDVSIDNLRGGPFSSRGGVAFQIDDAAECAATVWWPYLYSKGVPGTIYVASDNVGAGGMVTEAQLITAIGQGCCVANHGKTHTNFTTLTEEQIITEVETCRAYVDALGSSGGLHVAYPFGAASDTTRKVLDNLNYKTGRGDGSPYYNCLPALWPPNGLYYYSLGNTISLATAKGYVDTAVATGAVVMLVCHALVEGSPASSLEWNIDDFKDLVDYVVANNVPTYDIEQFWGLQRRWLL